MAKKAKLISLAPTYTALWAPSRGYLHRSSEMGSVIRKPQKAPSDVTNCNLYNVQGKAYKDEIFNERCFQRIWREKNC